MLITGSTLTQIMKTEARITVRPMQTQQDASGIVEMARELALALHDPRSPITAETLLRDGLGPERWFDCWVAEINSELAGYALACRSFDAHTGKKRLWLGDLYVRPSARLQGVGRSLFSAVARRAIALGCDVVYWELWKQNARGAAFYRQLDAQEVGDLVIMCLDGKALARIADDA